MTLNNRIGRMICAGLMVFSVALKANPSSAADRVVVIPLGKSGPPAPVAKTGQTVTYATGDDGDKEKGATISARFKDNGNGTVTDGLTGLIWLKDGKCVAFFSGDGTGVNKRNWANAIDAANKLSSGYCGLTDGSKAGDWRLPNRKELESLIDLGRTMPPALPAGCPLAASTFYDYYWSSTTYANYTAVAWLVDFSNGYVYYDYKSSSYYVRAVRGGQ
jgi:hypothetical protein